MNALLRHTGNIHRGMIIGTKLGTVIGIITNNIKSGFIFVGNGFTTAKSGIIGLMNTKL